MHPGLLFGQERSRGRVSPVSADEEVVCSLSSQGAFLSSTERGPPSFKIHRVQAATVGKCDPGTECGSAYDLKWRLQAYPARGTQPSS